MPKFEVFITETLTKAVTVEAENEEEALQEVRYGWKNEFYVLDAENFVDVEFKINSDMDTNWISL
ncbi:MAG: DpnD/PcfM family protein [Synergistaceae bacterium]|nr:DpnD/PcfM family protein [Synergistaceae bacterium]